ncbi:alpha-scruin-like [Amblyomma americanum]
MQLPNTARGQTKTESRACHSSLNCLAASQQSDPDYWSPLCKILPPMTPRTVDERNEILASFFDDSFYGDLATPLQLTTKGPCHNLMLIGGISPTQPDDYADGAAVLSYDPGNDRWRSYGFIPEPRCYHTAVIVRNNDVMVAGGLDPLCVTTSGHMQPSNKAFLFSSRRKRWIELPAMNRERAFHAAVGWHDRMMVFGGIDRTGRMLSSAEVYFFNANQWSLIHPMPMALMGMAAATIDTRVYIIGGISCGPDGDALQASIYMFDPSRDFWAELPAMPEKRAFSSAVPVQRDLWLVGGVVELKPKVECTTRIDVLRLASSTMEPRSDMPSPRHSVRVAKTGYEVYLVGGQDENNRPLDDVIAFDRARRSFMQCEPLPRALAGSATVVTTADRLDWLRLSGIWPGKKATPQIRERAATVIQKAYRNYRRGEGLQPRLKNASDIQNCEQDSRRAMLLVAAAFCGRAIFVACK